MFTNMYTLQNVSQRKCNTVYAQECNTVYIKDCGTVYAKECKSVRRSTILNNECRQVPSLGDSGVQEHLYIIAMKRCS